MQSRLWEPLYQRKLATVQVGMGQPSGGVMELELELELERGWSVAEKAVLDKARRPVRRE